MIQRAGRIDRLGTNFDQLFIYNCFPEEGLEELLGLVSRLQKRIATIDREVGLDASVLGETISDRSLEEIRRLKEADTDAEKSAILEELEQASDLVSLDEMRFPLLEFMQQMGKEAAEEIPLGIHSTRTVTTKDLDGIFLAFRARERHFWHFYPRINGHISTDPTKLVSDKRQIFKRLQCKQSDYPNPDNLPPVPFDNAIFAILEGATRNLLQDIKKQQTGSQMKPPLSKLLHKIETAFTQSDLSDLFSEPVDEEVKERVLKVIVASEGLRSFERDVKAVWDRFVSSKNLGVLIADLDELFIDQQLYHDIEQEESINQLNVIKEEEIQLVCYEWFKPG
jgi:hypothetical protein